MAKSSSKTQSFWRADWLAGLAIVVVAVVLHLSTDFIGTLERRFYDFASTSTSRQPSDRIAVIAIDDQSIANLGRWPWPRDIHAKLIDALAAAKAKTIVHTAFFFEPQVDPGLVFIRKMKAALDAPADGAAPNESLARLITEAEAALDTDAKLAASLGARVCERYTDVEGIYTTDPRLVPEARKLPVVRRLTIAARARKIAPHTVVIAANWTLTNQRAARTTIAHGTSASAGRSR